jgi:hypothetical protein
LTQEESQWLPILEAAAIAGFMASPSDEGSRKEFPQE